MNTITNNHPTLKTITEKLSDLDSFSFRGSFCSFYPITRCWGAKSFETEYSRDLAFKGQIIAASAGFAPQAGITFEHKGRFWYTTEIAEVVGYKTNVPEEEYHYYHKCHELAYRLKRIFIDIDKDYLYKLFNDTHLYNVAYLNGDMVWIDFCNEHLQESI